MTRGRARTIVLGALAALLVLIVVAASGVWWVVSTEQGGRWGLARLSATVPGTLRVGGLRGRLWGPLELRDVRYANDQTEVEARRILLDWRPRELLERRLDVRSLEATGVRVRLLESAAPDTAAPGPPPDVEPPVAVRLDRLKLDDFEVTPAGAAAPIALVEATAEGVTWRDTLRIARLRARSDSTRLELSGWILPRGDYPLDVAARASARIEGAGPAAGEARLSGSLAGLRATARLERPVEARLDAGIAHALETPQFHASLEVPTFTLRALGPGLPDGRASLRLTARGTPARALITGPITLRLTGLGDLAVETGIEATGDSIVIRRLDVRVPGRRARIDAEGAMRLGAVPSFRLDAAWSDVVWPLAGDTLIASPRGRADLEGVPGDYVLRAEAMVAARPLVPERWTLAASGDTAGIAVQALEGEVLGGSVTARGALGWAPEVAWGFDVDAAGLDPSQLARAWPGDVTVAARVRGRLERGGPVGRVELDRVGGTLRGAALEGGGAIAMTAAGTLDPDVRLSWGDARVAVSGAFGDSLSGTADVVAPRLAGLVPGMAGAIEVHLTAAGPRAVPRVTAKASAESLVTAAFSAAGVSLDADLDLAPGGRLDLDLEARDLLAGGRPLDRLRIESRGPHDAHRITAALEAGGDTVSTALEGRWSGHDWRGRVTALDAVSKSLGNWKLEETAGLAVTDSSFALDSLCIASGEGRVCAVASGGSGGVWDLDATLDGIPMTLFQTGLPQGTTITGTIAGRVSARARGGPPALDVDLAPGPGEIGFPAGTGAQGRVDYRDGRVVAVTSGDTLRGRLTLDLTDVGTIEGTLTLPRWGEPDLPAGDAPVSGRLKATLRDLALIQAFVPGLTGAHGSLDADFTIGGSLGKPQVGGETRITGAGGRVPALGLDLRDVALTLTGAPDGGLKIDGDARSGPGRVTVSGSAGLDGPKPKARIVIAGSRFQAANTGEVSLLVSPNLTVTVDGDSVNLGGQVEVPKGRIDLSETPQAAVPLSGDVVFVGGADSTLARGPKVAARVRVVLGDSISVDAFGLRAKPSGALLAIDEPGRPTTGTGELTLAGGTYAAYGQDLAIERGRLIFGGGPIDDPGLDIRASRTAADGVVAGIEVRGTLKSPQLTVFSDPAMPESDALAYIVLGHSIEQATQNEQGVVTQAATALGLQQGSLIASRLARSVGLDEARIESGGSLQDASLLLGTYLSPKLYVNYGIGLVDPVSSFRVQYLLSRKWTIQVRTSEQSSAEIRYTIEH